MKKRSEWFLRWKKGVIIGLFVILLIYLTFVWMFGGLLSNLGGETLVPPQGPGLWIIPGFIFTVYMAFYVLSSLIFLPLFGETILYYVFIFVLIVILSAAVYVLVTYLFRLFPVLRTKKSIFFLGGALLLLMIGITFTNSMESFDSLGDPEINTSINVNSELFTNFYYNLAVDRQEPEICGLLFDVEPNYYLSDFSIGFSSTNIVSCYEQAGSALRPSACENFKSSENKNKCLALFVEREKDFSLCDKITAEKEKGTCYYKKALDAGIAVCANLSSPIAADSCFYKFYQNWPLKASCEKIVDTQYRGRCYGNKALSNGGEYEAVVAGCANLTSDIADICYDGIAGSAIYGSLPCNLIINEELKQSCLARTGGT